MMCTARYVENAHPSKKLADVGPG